MPNLTLSTSGHNLTGQNFNNGGQIDIAVFSDSGSTQSAGVTVITSGGKAAVTVSKSSVDPGGSGSSNDFSITAPSVTGNYEVRVIQSIKVGQSYVIYSGIVTGTVSSASTDTTPNAFSFTDVSNATRNTYSYAYVQITGINAAATVSGSSSATYGFAVSSSTSQPSASSFTTANKTITNGQYLHVRVLSSSSYSTAVGATITVGGVSDTFTVTTEADTTPTYSLTAPTSINEGSSGTCSVSTTNVANGTTLYWSVSPTGDFSTTTGTVSISGGSGSFSVTPTADSTTEGAETASVILWSNSARTVQVASDTFTINDTSTASGGGSTGSGTGGSSTYGLSIKSTTSSATEIFGVNVRTTNIQVYQTGTIAGNGGTRTHTGLGSDVTDDTKVQVIVDAGWYSSSGTFPVTRSTANGGQVTITNNRNTNATVTSLIIRLA